ncbi:MAG: TetR/AcrR family transcriptional regulator [Myxococcales bacterium]|nr:TetR/AcrR family transcriptional regulator [Myxococcales bacterium]
MKPRPRRGTAEETRARLVAAAAEVFNRDGYGGTDSNRLARAAGYAPGVFYKHFDDKKQLFLAVYVEWVAAELAALGQALEEGRPPAALARRIVALIVDHHRRWHGFRASLRALVATDAEVRRFHRKERKKQLAAIARLQRGGGRRFSAAHDALLMFTIERTADAIGDGEADALGVDSDALITLLEALVRERL